MTTARDKACWWSVVRGAPAAVTLTNKTGQVIAVAESARVAARINAVDKECWWNAVRALRTVYRNDPTARYVEGYAVSKFGLPMSHGWLEVGGRIVDPTPVWMAKGDDTPIYFPGVKYTVADLRGVRITVPCALPLVHARHGYGPDVPTGYRDAHHAAHALAFNLTPDAVTAFFNGSGGVHV